VRSLRQKIERHNILLGPEKPEKPEKPESAEKG